MTTQTFEFITDAELHDASGGFWSALAKPLVRSVTKQAVKTIAKEAGKEIAKEAGGAVIDELANSLVF